METSYCSIMQRFSRIRVNHHCCYNCEISIIINRIADLPMSVAIQAMSIVFSRSRFSFANDEDLLLVDIALLC